MEKEGCTVKLCIIRALRPDGICYKAICGTEAWREYVSSRTVPFSESFERAGPMTPIFFVLSPGMDPLKDVESLGKKLGYTAISKNFHNISLGQQTNKPPSRVFANLHKLWTILLKRLWKPLQKRSQV